MSTSSVESEVECTSILFNLKKSSRVINSRTHLGRLLEGHLRQGKLLLLKYESSLIEFEIIPYYLGQEFFLELEDIFPDQELAWRTEEQITIDVNLQQLELSSGTRHLVFKPITQTLKNGSSFLQETRNLMRKRDSFTNSQQANDELRVFESSLLELANRIYDDTSSVKIHVFGSRLTGLATCKSDVDIYMEKDSFYKTFSHEEQGEMVELFAKGMKNSPKSEFRNVVSIPTAYVPIVKFQHKSLNLNCDLSFKSGINVLNSRLVKIYLSLDDRVKLVICGVNFWMQKTGSPFISYAQIWMVLFFLMQKKYSVVPTLQELRSHMPAKERMLLIEGWNCACPDITDVGWWRKDQCTLSAEKLLRKFFVFYGDMSLQEYVLCTSTGLKVKKKKIVVECEKLVRNLPAIENFETNMIIRFRDSNNFCIQDPFDLCKNLTKNVNLNHKFTKFVKRCEQTKELLRES